MLVKSEGGAIAGISAIYGTMRFYWGRTGFPNMWVIAHFFQSCGASPCIL